MIKPFQVSWLVIDLETTMNRAIHEPCYKDSFDWREYVCRPCEKKSFSVLGSLANDGWYHHKEWEEKKRMILKERRSTIPRIRRWIRRREVVRNDLNQFLNLTVVVRNCLSQLLNLTSKELTCTLVP